MTHPIINSFHPFIILHFDKQIVNVLHSFWICEHLLSLLNLYIHLCYGSLILGIASTRLFFRQPA